MKLINFFIRKHSQLFNLKNKNTSLQAKVTQDTEKFDWLKLEMKKLYARLDDLINAAIIQSKKIEEKSV